VIEDCRLPIADCQLPMAARLRASWDSWHGRLAHAFSSIRSARAVLPCRVNASQSAIGNRRSAISARRLRRRGAIFVTALGIVVILSGLILVFAQEMRTEAIASANRLSYLQADAVEQGAEKSKTGRES